MNDLNKLRDSLYQEITLRHPVSGVDFKAKIVGFGRTLGGDLLDRWYTTFEAVVVVDDGPVHYGERFRGYFFTVTEDGEEVEIPAVYDEPQPVWLDESGRLFDQSRQPVAPMFYNGRQVGYAPAEGGEGLETQLRRLGFPKETSVTREDNGLRYVIR
jgi:hypothetical protein